MSSSSTSPTPGARRCYDDDYVNPAMLDGADAESHGDGDTLTATLTNRRLLSRLQAFVRSEAGQRRLSDEAFTAGLAAQKHLLRALFTADGDVSNGTLELRSDSRGLLEDVQLILLGFGVQSAVCRLISSITHDITDEGGAFVSGELPDRQVRTTTAGPPTAGDAAIRRHGLRIDPGSLRSFAQHVGLLPGKKLDAAGRRDRRLRRSPRPSDRRQLRSRRHAHARWAGSRSSISPSRSRTRSSPTA